MEMQTLGKTLVEVEAKALVWTHRWRHLKRHCPKLETEVLVVTQVDMLKKLKAQTLARL